MVTGKQVIEWSCYAQNRRRTEGITGAWWELIPEDQKPLAQEWIKANIPEFAEVFGKPPEGSKPGDTHIWGEKEIENPGNTIASLVIPAINVQRRFHGF